MWISWISGANLFCHVFLDSIRITLRFESSDPATLTAAISILAVSSWPLFLGHGLQLCLLDSYQLLFANCFLRSTRQPYALLLPLVYQIPTTKSPFSHTRKRGLSFNWLKELFRTFLKYPSGISSSRIMPAGPALGF